MNRKEMILDNIKGWKITLLKEQAHEESDKQKNIPNFADWARERIVELQKELDMLEECEHNPLIGPENTAFN